jgi:protein MpaA
MSSNLQIPKLLFSLLLLLSLVNCNVLRDRVSVDAGTPAESGASAESEVPTDPEIRIEAPIEFEAKVEPEAPSETRTSDTKVLIEPSPEVTPETVPAPESKSEPEALAQVKTEPQKQVVAGVNPTIELCSEVGRKLGSVSVEDCLSQNLVHSGFSIARRSLAFKDYPPVAGREPLGRVLVIGGIHGDEFSSVSVLIKWMKILDKNHSGLFHWRFVPTANPDGLLNRKSQRQNQNGVDLNRNFPTSDWKVNALSYWEHKTNRNPRRYPGPYQASEPETQWLVKQISEFNPEAIISLHAPYHLVDYDGPPTAPEVLGGLSLRRLGVYPGSLGNYAGIDLEMPIVTVELKSAGIMPRKKEIEGMWRDLVRWLRGQLSKSTRLR